VHVDLTGQAAANAIERWSKLFKTGSTANMGMEVFDEHE
jgi:hypothetical protein